MATPLVVQGVYELIWRGSFPAMTANPQMGWKLFYASYLQTYVQRDVRDLARVGDEMACDAEVAPNTAKSWLSILEASGLVYLLPPWHSNLTKRLVKTPKLYFLDTGLCAYLTQWSSPQALEAGAMSGAIFETWVVVELLKSYWHQAPFYYYRNKDQREIDLLIESDGVLYPVETKKSVSPSGDALRGMAALERLGVACGTGAVICMVSQLLPLGREVRAVPVGCV